MDTYGLGPEASETQRRIQALLDGLPLDEHQWEIQGRFPWAELQTLAGNGLAGLTFPEELGGSGASRLDAVLVLEQVASRSFTLAEALQIATNGPSFVLAQLAAPAVRERYVPDVAAGRSLISIAITEEQAGSALGEIETSAVINGDQVVVNGRKCFVTAGGLATAHLVMARFGNATGTRGLGYVLVPADTPGCRVVHLHEKMGGNAVPEAVIDFADCEVPRDHVIIPGDPESSAGFREAMTTYNAMRVGIAAIGCGVAARAIESTAEHLAQREQFGQRLADFQGLRWRLARLAVDLEAARLLTYRAARNVDERGFPGAGETAFAKLAASELAVRAADEAVQMRGWRGVVRDEDHAAERLFREVRGWTIAGGTSESLLNFVADSLFRDLKV